METTTGLVLIVFGLEIVIGLVTRVICLINEVIMVVFVFKTGRETGIAELVITAILVFVLVIVVISFVIGVITTISVTTGSSME